MPQAARADEPRSETFRFDQGFHTSGDLQFRFARARTTFDALGWPVAAHTPRYSPVMRALAGAPLVRQDVRTDEGLGAAIEVAASGVSADGVTPLLILWAVDPGRVQVRRINADASLTTLHDHPTGQPGGPRNMLYGEAAQTPNVRYEPTGSFSVCHGLITSIAQVYVQSGSEWVRSRTAVCYFDMTSPQLGWRVVDPGPGENVQVGKARGSPFQCSGFSVLDSGPVLRAWLPFADYVNNSVSAGPGQPLIQSDMGTFYLLRADRAGVNQPWTVGAVSRVYQTPPRATTPLAGTFGQHAHPPYIEKFGSDGYRMVLPIGDSWCNSRVAIATRSDANYTGAWSVVEDRHGTFGTEMDPTVGLGNQFVGSAAGAAPGVRIIGSDEMSVPLCALTMSQNPQDKLNFVRVWGQAPAAPNRAQPGARQFNWNVFQIGGDATRDGLAALILPGKQSGWLTISSATRIAYSLDGSLWSQAWSPNDIQTWPVQVAGGRIYHGSADRNRKLGVRSTRVPVVAALHPLLVAGGGQQMRTAPVLFAGSVGSGASVTARSRADVLAMGLSMPPCADGVFECRVGAPGVSASRDVGTWRVAQGILPTVPSNGGTPQALIKLRAWVCPLPWAGAAQASANSLSLSMDLGAASGGSVIASRESISLAAIQCVGSAGSPWIPLTIDTSSWAWTNELTGAPSIPTQAFDLGVRVREMGGPVTNPSAFLIAFESVQVGAGELYSYPAGSAGAMPPEQARITNLACAETSQGGSWSIALAGEVPDDCWDQTIDVPQRDARIALATLYQDPFHHMQVFAVPDAHALDFDVTSGSSVRTSRVLAMGAAQNSESFSFLRNSPVLLGVHSAPTKSTFMVSVGGTQVSLESAPPLDFTPREVRLGDAALTDFGAMVWYGGRVDGRGHRSAADVRESLRTLDFLRE